MTLIENNDFYDLVRVVKGHTTYIEIGDDLGFVAVCYSDFCVEREDDSKVLTNTQPASVNTSVSPDFRESVWFETTTPPRRNIRIVSPNKYGVYIDEEGNTYGKDGRIINVSKEDIQTILEMENILGGCYLSLPQYEGSFQMPRVHPTPDFPPGHATYNIDHVKELIIDVSTAYDRMIDEFYKNVDAIYFSLNNSIAWYQKYGRARAESGLHI